MNNPEPFAAFVLQIEEAVRFAIAELDTRFSPHDPAEKQANFPWEQTLERLAEQFAGWQEILAQTSEQVHQANEELTTHETALRKSLETFATVKRVLEGHKPS